MMEPTLRVVTNENLSVWRRWTVYVPYATEQLMDWLSRNAIWWRVDRDTAEMAGVAIAVVLWELRTREDVIASVHLCTTAIATAELIMTEPDTLVLAQPGAVHRALVTEEVLSDSDSDDEPADTPEDEADNVQQFMRDFLQQGGQLEEMQIW